MTERGHAQRLLARLPDTEMEVVAGFLAWRACLAVIDEWGDLRARSGDGGVLRRLDEAERAEFGETLWEEWQRLEREGKIDPNPAAPPEPPPDADEEARRRREYSEWWIEHLPEPDMPVVLAFLAWRERRSLRPRGGPAAWMAAAGAEAMRLLGEAERRLFGKRAHDKTAGERSIDEELVDELGGKAEEGYDVEETRGVDEQESAKQQLRLIIVYEPDEERVVASIPAVPGVLSRGRTREKARINVLDALAEMIDLREPEYEPRAAAIERESLRIGLGERMTADEGKGETRSLDGPRPAARRLRCRARGDGPARRRVPRGKSRRQGDRLARDERGGRETVGGTRCGAREKHQRGPGRTGPQSLSHPGSERLTESSGGAKSTTGSPSRVITNSSPFSTRARSPKKSASASSMLTLSGTNRRYQDPSP